jgi:hypothetical protein
MNSSPDGTGLHLDLGEWIFQEGAWRSLYEIVSLEDAVAVKSELLGNWKPFAL